MRAALVLALVLVASAAAGAAWAFQPGDPLAAQQWYLAADRPFELWATPPALAPVRVAVIDSGIDLGHPEFAGRIVATRSFVGGSVADTYGHGTFIAGEIAATLGNGEGIAGIAFPAQLVVAKVLRPDGTIHPRDEARAIRWALAQGAKVINLSFGGVRDPSDAGQDTFSGVEQDAIDDAVRAGAVVVAAAGNGDQSPRQPWPYANYPAALPHVIGVSAYARDGSVPEFSNRDRILNDIAAPGTEMLSTFPRALTTTDAGCANQGYSSCGPPVYHNAAGTSFAAPQVSAAAALLLAVRPDLRPEQVAVLLERSAVDASPANGCAGCAVGRDEFTGWGKLDVAAALRALSGPLPPADHLEPNDSLSALAPTLDEQRLTLRATLDFWDDRADFYRVSLQKGQWLYARVDGQAAASVSLWQSSGRRIKFRDRQFLYRAPADDFYFVKVWLGSPASGPYDLRIERS
jgi:subtilase family protein